MLQPNDKPKKPKLDLSLPKETHAQREAEAVISDADIANAKNFIADMKEVGVYMDGKKIGKVNAGQVRKLMESGTEGVN